VPPLLSLRCCRGSPESQRKSRASPSDGARFGSGPRFSVLDQLNSSGIPEYLCSTSFAKHVAQCNFLTASLKSYCVDGLILSWVTPTFYDYKSILSTLRNRRVDQSASQPSCKCQRTKNRKRLAMLGHAELLAANSLRRCRRAAASYSIGLIQWRSKLPLGRLIFGVSRHHQKWLKWSKHLYRIRSHKFIFLYMTMGYRLTGWAIVLHDLLLRRACKDHCN
jgi:hypothetical protein